MVENGLDWPQPERQNKHLFSKHFFFSMRKTA